MTEADWAREIRAYGLGRLSRHRDSDTVAEEAVHLALAPVRRWWVFEGLEHPVLGGPLGEHWEDVARRIERLLQGFHPKKRHTEHPFGDVDWPRTLLDPTVTVPRRYVVNASGVGLDETERAMLLGWCHWIVEEWRAWCATWGKQATCALDRWHPITPVAPTPRTLQRWASTARRARWPLLREVVSETLRASLEPRVLDRLPLPVKRDQLFELLCLVRALRALAPEPRALRWLHRETDNRVAVPGVVGRFQHTLDKADVKERAYTPELRVAADRFGLGVHQHVDVLVEVSRPDAPFDRLILEAKSGAQSQDAATDQLRDYARTIRCRRALVWALVERRAPLEPHVLDALAEDARTGTGPLWVFSPPADIPRVLRAVGLVRPL